MHRWLAALALTFLAACSARVGGVSESTSSTGATSGTSVASSTGSTSTASAGGTVGSSSGTHSSATSGASSTGGSGSQATGSTSNSGATASSTSGSGSSGSSTGSSGTTGANLCAGSAVFCDVFIQGALAGAYTTRHGNWQRNAGSYTVNDSVAWERARSVLAEDVTDFDVTIEGASLGDSGLGVVYAGSATDDDGYAVLIHPAQFQGVYLKQLIPGQQDRDIQHVALPSPSPGVNHRLRVQRSGTLVTVTLDGSVLFSADDGGTAAHGRLGLLSSITDQVQGAGARFGLMRVDNWTDWVPPVDAGAGDGGWQLVWSDEFNAPDGTSPDPNTWVAEVGGQGWGNQELEYYTQPTANAEQRGGNLVITAMPSTPGALSCWYGDCQYTSARLITKGMVERQYGRFEASIQIPRGQGLWPAFWLLGANIDQVGWPACGEVDIMENVGKEPARDYGTLHAPGFNQGSYADVAQGALADGFHLYAVEWEPGVVRFYLDTTLYETLTPADVPSGGTWAFDDGPYFMLLNVAVGGTWPGSPDATTVFPQQMLVDYVRVYTR